MNQRPARVHADKFSADGSIAAPKIAAAGGRE